MTENLKVPGNATVVGLGYVGLPLALAFSKELPTTGFDIDVSRVEELATGNDRNREVPEEEIVTSTLTLTADASCVSDAEFIVVTVPTPVTEDHKPDLSLLESASTMIGRQLYERSEGLPAPIVVYESTTFPGCTEEFCGPIIERESGLKVGEGFFLGYSPERTNFGDQEHTLKTVIKIVSGQTPEVAKIVSETYGLIAEAGVHLAPDIKTAEAAKVIENVQRDLNIALFNEFAMIFDRMNIRSSDVFDAAATKWNFHRYKPGLVGGHCIPVDPYYLTAKAQELGINPKIVLAGRGINENMPEFISEKILSLLDISEERSSEPSILILGQTFKADVADFRNSKAISLARHLSTKGARVNVFEPLVPAEVGGWADLAAAANPFDLPEKFDAVVIATPHRQFIDRFDEVVCLTHDGGLIVDVTGSMDAARIRKMDRLYWSP